MRYELSLDVFDRLQPDGLNRRLVPLGVLKPSDIFPLKTEDVEHTAVEAYDVSILPIASGVIGLRIKEVITQVNAQGLEPACDETRSGPVHAQDRYNP